MSASGADQLSVKLFLHDLVIPKAWESLSNPLLQALWRLLRSRQSPEQPWAVVLIACCVLLPVASSPLRVSLINLAAQR